MSNKIVMIPIGELEHHPENPRKDLGDLSELTESIRKNGIYQNLTVVPDMDKAKYMVIIGNRRMEAAKAAGMADLPCVISDMDHKEQIATMLEENMQRQDLTVFEQAQGFQMMMDLGYTAKQISEKTGFSEKTVKDRIKLTKFNQKKFSEAVNNGATLFDLIEISKLKNKRDQNEVLESAGTDNFRYKLQRKLKDQKFEEDKERLEPIVKEFAEPLPEKWSYTNYQEIYNPDLRMDKKEDALRKTIKKATKGHEGPFFYQFRQYSDTGHVEIYFRRCAAGGSMSDEQKTERQRSIARGKHVRKVKGYWAQAYDLRKDFIANYTTSTNGIGMTTIGKLIAKYALSAKSNWGGEVLPKNHEWDGKYIREVLGLQQEEYEEKRTIWEMLEGRNDIPQIRAVIAWICGGGIFWPDDPEHGLYDSYDGKYSAGSYQANGIKELYQFLEEIGYQMSDMEKQLMDGTHECYRMDA